MSAAVSRGRRLDDERLRAAAVDHARRSLADLQWRTATRGRRVVLVLLALWLVLQVAGVVVTLVTGDLDDVPWSTVVALTGGAAAVVVLRRRMRRAPELDGGS